MLKLLKILVVLFVLLYAGSFLLPAEYHVERSVVMEAPPAEIHQHVADLRAWKAWSWWEKQMEGIETTYSGPPAGVGAGMQWSHPDSVGEMTLTAADPATGVEWVTLMEEEFEGTGGVRYEPVEGGTRVTWWDAGSMEGGAFYHRYFALLLDDMLGEAFEQNLAAIKEIVEA